MSRPDLSACRLYGILDLSYVAFEAAARVAQEMIDGGVDVLQLRGKQQTRLELEHTARQLLPITKAGNVPLVINDHPEVARATRADGVHIGQDDGTVREARHATSEHALVGKSTHSVAQAIAAEVEGADYIGFGPLFATPTKPEYQPIGTDMIAEVHARVRIPIFCIGGIKLENLASVIGAGARRVVIVSGLLQAANIADYASSAQRLLTDSN